MRLHRLATTRQKLWIGAVELTCFALALEKHAQHVALNFVVSRVVFPLKLTVTGDLPTIIWLSCVRKLTNAVLQAHRPLVSLPWLASFGDAVCLPALQFYCAGNG
jgi:hypothetical protein